MNLFWKKLTGAITSTAKIEKNEAELAQAMHRYYEVEKSLELAEYQKLFHEVKAASFIENKKTLQNRKYKDTEEYRTTTKLRKLQNSPSILSYFRVLNSPELKEYEAFKLSPEFENLGDKAKVKASEMLTRLKNFERSKAYRNYMRYHKSYIIQEFEHLKEVVSTPDFKKSNDFWANDKRWHTVPEYAKEQRFYELAKNPDIAFFINEKPERFDKYKSLKLTFSDDFKWNTLDKSRWNYGFQYSGRNLVGNHSFANEKQCNNAGKNISVEHDTLRILTKHEKITAPAWHTQKGFISKEFQYTSDVLQTAGEFRQKYGIFRAKLRCNGKLHHAFWLGADGKLPHINIFHFDGKQITVGNANNNIFDGVEINGINPHEYFIYTLIWKNNELIWMINNIEVYRTTSNIPQEPLYLAFNSFIPEKMHGDTGQLEVDWVKVYAE